MKKRALIILTVVIAAGLAVVGLTVLSGDGQNSTSQNNSNVPVATLSTEACELLTLEDAKAILGDTAKARTSGSERHEHDPGTPEDHPHPNDPPTIPNITLSTCAYSATSSGDSLFKSDAISFNIRTPQNAEGVTANQAAASEYVEAGTKIEGYENAYWIADRNVLVVVHDDQLIVATRTTSNIELGNNPSAPPETKLTYASQEQSTAILEAIKEKL